MKSFINKIFFLSFILICIFNFQIFADNNTDYIDVPETHLYYESIMDLTKKGIVSGTGGKTFSPDREISYDEYTVILMRMFYNDYWCCVESKGIEWAKSFTSTAECIGIYYPEELEKIKKDRITWDIVLRSAVVVSNFEPYPFWMYEDIIPENDFIKDVKFALIKQGVFPESFDWDETPTRGEIIHLMYCITSEEYLSIEEPIYLNKYGINIEYDMNGENCSRLRNDILYELSLIPQKYISAFNEQGWTIQLIDEMRNYYPKHILASGMTSSLRKTITLSLSFYNYDKFTLVHEFGHFIDCACDLVLVPKYIYDFEKENIGLLMGEYSQVNNAECFAECFCYILINYNNLEKYDEMKKLIPMALEYIEYGLIKAEDLCDFDSINVTTDKYFDVYANPIGEG